MGDMGFTSIYHRLQLSFGERPPTGPPDPVLSKYWMVPGAIASEPVQRQLEEADLVFFGFRM